MKNLIAFRKKLVVGKLTNKLKNNESVLRFQHLLMKYGYMLSETAYNALLKMDEDQLTKLYTDIHQYFLETIGNSNAKELEELYYMFANETEHQKQIRLAKEQRDLRLKKYAVIYTDNIYTSMQSYCNLIWNSKSNKDIPQVYETTKFIEINYATEDEFKKIFTDLVKIGTALTPTDFSTVEWFAKEYGNDNIMPDSIPFKENLCMVASLGLDVPVKTTTDVLRIATYMSNGTTDLILPPKMVRSNAWTNNLIENVKRKEANFKKFKRAERRYLLSLLESVVDVKEMVLKRSRWIKLGEILHPGDYANQYPLSANAFKLLRNTKVKSWYSDVDAAFSKSFSKGLTKLSERPGEFVRKLDALIRKNETKIDEILDIFEKIGHKISTKVLWEIYTHFNKRNNVDNDRSIWIKGARKKTNLPTLDPLDESIIVKVQSIIIELITKRFAKLDKLGNVYIDTELKKIPVPTNMRTLQESKKVIIRGTRMPLQPTKKVLRPYIHWTAGVDLDISISFIDYNNQTTFCSYKQLNPHPSVLHSGDVIPSVKGEWAEYVDIDIENCPFKYGLVQVHNYGGGSLENVGAVIGFMERDNLQSSKKWKPNTIENSFKVSSEGSTVNLMIIDFETKEWILIDEDSSQYPMTGNNDILKYIENISKEPKLSVYDVLNMHTTARGILVEDEKNSDTKFLFDDFSTSYEKIAEYML